MPQTITVRDNIYLETITTFLCYNNFKVYNNAARDVQMNYNICKPNYPFSKHSLFTFLKTSYYTHKKIKLTKDYIFTYSIEKVLQIPITMFFYVSSYTAMLKSIRITAFFKINRISGVHYLKLTNFTCF